MYLLDVAYPVPDVIEGLLVGDVIHQHDALKHKRQEVTYSVTSVQEVPDQLLMCLKKTHSEHSLMDEQCSYKGTMCFISHNI